MKACRLFQSLILIAILCIASAGASAQYSPSTSGLSSFMVSPVSYTSPFYTPDIVSGFSFMDDPGSLSSISDLSGFFNTGNIGGLQSSDTSLFGFPVLSDMGSLGNMGFSPSQLSMSSPIGIPDMQIPGMLSEPSQGDQSQVSSGISPHTTNNYTYASNGKTIRVKLGDTFYVQLASRIDLGDIWDVSVTDGLNISATCMYQPTFVDSDIGNGVIGLESTEEWTIKAIQPGTQKVTGIYNSSDSTPGVNGQNFGLTVIVYE